MGLYRGGGEGEGGLREVVIHDPPDDFYGS